MDRSGKPRADADRPLRIAQVAPPMEAVPPRAYGGTERVIHELVTGLHARGHDVTTFATADSTVPGHHVATAPAGLRASGEEFPERWLPDTLDKVAEQAAEFDLIHCHLEWASLLLPRMTSVPVVTTFHGRLDAPFSRGLLEHAMCELVAISESQASAHPAIDFTVVHNGLTLDGRPPQRGSLDALCFVGRLSPEKGAVDAIEVAKRTGRPLRIAAKAGPTEAERAYVEQVFRPALKEAGPLVEFLGELDGAERDLLFASSCATLMPGSWPEPFGLVAIESLACGTPVIARRVGALPEIVRDRVDGFLADDAAQMAFRVDDVGGLDREAIRTSVRERFSAERMTDAYEELYRRMLGGERPTRLRAPRHRAPHRRSPRDTRAATA